MAASTPLLERRRKISYIHIILIREPLFSNHPYIRPQAAPKGVEKGAERQARAVMLGPAPWAHPSTGSGRISG